LAGNEIFVGQLKFLDVAPKFYIPGAGLHPRPYLQAGGARPKLRYKIRLYNILRFYLSYLPVSPASAMTSSVPVGDGLVR
jgi:hypothetical protein